MLRLIWFLICFHAAPALAEPLEFSVSSTETPANISKAMSVLAAHAIEIYHDNDRARYLDTLFRLQLVTGLYPGAAKTLSELRILRADVASPGTAAKDLQYEIFLRAKTLETTAGLAFDEAFARSFRERLAHLDDKTSAMVVRAMSHYSAGISLYSPIEENLQAALFLRKDKSD